MINEIISLIIKETTDLKYLIEVESFWIESSLFVVLSKNENLLSFNSVSEGNSKKKF